LSSVPKPIFNQLAYTFSDPVAEKESQEYAACTFLLNGLWVKFRSAKITPTKTGQFVTLWKRDEEGITQPHDGSDDINLFIISTRKDDCAGYFIFPKSVLLEKGILSGKNKPGKRGFRVYPSWDKAENKQAQASQRWQLMYFLEIESGNAFNEDRARQLFQS